MYPQLPLLAHNVHIRRASDLLIRHYSRRSVPGLTSRCTPVLPSVAEGQLMDGIPMPELLPDCENEIMSVLNESRGTYYMQCM